MDAGNSIRWRQVIGCCDSWGEQPKDKQFCQCRTQAQARFCVQLAEPLQHHCELLPRTLNDFGGYNWTDTRVDFRMMDPKKTPQSHKVLPVFYTQTVPTCFSFDCESALKRRRMWFIALSITDD